MELLFRVNEQTLVRVDKKDVVADSLNYLTCKFEFSKDWGDVIKTAVFVSNTDAVYNVILEDDCCIVPWEVICKPSFDVSAFGGSRITTNSVRVDVTGSGCREGDESREPTPDVYEQILAKLENVDGVTPEQIQEAVNEYLQENPIQTEETDPTVPSWAKQPNKPTYTANEVGAHDSKYVNDEFRKTNELISNHYTETQILRTTIEGLQTQINEEAHFRGYLSTNAKIQAMEATPNDFAYSAESGTKWVYDEKDGWVDTNTPVPDQLTPASEFTPLMNNGIGNKGKEDAYSRGDHVHPSDVTKVDKTEFDELKADINSALDEIIAIQNELIGGAS